MKDYIILVDKNDNEIGVEEKLKAHEHGKLHRAFSIFVYNSNGQLLLQQRAELKYHCGGLWSNTCCSHPRRNESLEEATHKRLHEEMGFDCNLKKEFSFIYKAEVNNGLIEHEFDHVFTGVYDGEVNPSYNECKDYKWVKVEQLRKDVLKNPQKYTPWLKIALKYYENHK